MVIKGRPHFTVVRASLASIGLETCRYVWWGCQRAMPGVASFYIPLPFTNKKGENGIVVPFCLAAPAMERFVKELDGMSTDQPVN
jgi:hypothetical protein